MLLTKIITLRARATMTTIAVIVVKSYGDENYYAPRPCDYVSFEPATLAELICISFHCLQRKPYFYLFESVKYSNLTFYCLYPQCLTQAAISSGETFDKIECIAVIKVSTVRAFNFLKPALR
jgi:hypothetical protein